MTHTTDFISRAIIIHDNNYDYSLTRYDKAKKKVKIICKIHGIFEQTPNTHLNGSGCPKCGKIRSQKGYFKKEIYINEKFFDVLREKQIWLIGLFAADGCVNKYGRINISQSGESGYLLISYLCDILYIDKKHISSIKTIREYSYRISFDSKILLEIFKQYNIIRNKTYIYDFPNSLNTIYLKDFIRGYIDGDGCVTISRNKQGYEYLNVSFVGTVPFIKKCYRLLPVKGKISKKGINLCEIRWYGKNAIRLCKWLYSSDGLYEGYKYNNFYEYEKNHVYKQDIYKKIKKGIKKELLLKIPVKEIAKKFNINFQYVYYWKKKWGIA